jgi:CcmD family protein
MVPFKRALAFVLMMICLVIAAAPMHAQQPAPRPQQQDEFVPIDQLPPQDQMPAAPLLVAAYSFLMLALFGYVLSLARRMSAVRQEIQRLESNLKRGS